ncbi:MAG: YebC/PmpR family DNA-binding transcriptional regulator [Spirochaetes bacterium]|nr:YebC/PmpR family DNA-binding transcriptional regulator [Spirochaetota bacterium]MBN2771205.1 YebC/PmpR family DNA-binding transcriptional regulator [Spirochaetota bacterium]
MSGHNKWSTIKRKKGANDAKRGAIFTKLIREITVAVKNGGEDLNSNPRLRTAVAKARENNMPMDNIERAILKASGKMEGVVYEEMRYEGYGPGGVALMVDVITDNKNRTHPEIRTIFGKNGGNLGESGCVGFMFDRKGMIILDPDQTDEDTVMELTVDYDIEDIKINDDNSITIITSPESFNDVNDLITSKSLSTSFNEITFIPQTTVDLDEKKAEQCMRLVELLEDHDDIQNVYGNYEISDEIMEKIQS